MLVNLKLDLDARYWDLMKSFYNHPFDFEKLNPNNQDLVRAMIDIGFIKFNLNIQKYQLTRAAEFLMNVCKQ